MFKRICFILLWLMPLAVFARYDIYNPTVFSAYPHMEFFYDDAIDGYYVRANDFPRYDHEANWWDYSPVDESELIDIVIPSRLPYGDPKDNVSKPVIGILGYGFNECCLRSIHIPKTVRVLGGACFHKCYQLKTVTGMEGVEVIEEYALKATHDLKNFAWPQGLKRIGKYAFEGSSSLENINLPESVEYIDQWAFKDMKSLRHVKLPKHIDYIGDGLFQSSTIESIEWPENIDEIPPTAFRWSYIKKDLAIPSNVRHIGDCAFEGAHFVGTKLIIPASVETVGRMAFRAVWFDELVIEDSEKPLEFENCNYGGYNDEDDEWYFDFTVEWLEYPDFPSVRKLYLGREVNLPIFIKSLIDSVTIGNATEICPGLFARSTVKSVEFLGNVKVIGECAFQYCDSLRSICLPERLDSIGQYAFGNMKNLDTLVIGKHMTEIDDYAFANSTIRRLTIPGNIKRIGNGAFSGATIPIEALLLNEGLETIGQSAFDGCLCWRPYLDIPSTVTSIGKHAFSGMRPLRSVNIPASVKEIGVGAFDTSYIKDVRVNKLAPVKNSNIFGSDTYSDGTLYVPRKALDEYEAAVGWSNFKNIKCNDEPVGVRSVEIINSFYYTSLGHEGTFIPAICPHFADNQSVSWHSSDTTIFTIDDTGYYKCVSPGECKYTCVSDENKDIKVSFTVNVRPDEVRPITEEELPTGVYLISVPRWKESTGKFLDHERAVLKMTDQPKNCYWYVESKGDNRYVITNLETEKCLIHKPESCPRNI